VVPFFIQYDSGFVDLPCADFFSYTPSASQIKQIVNIMEKAGVPVLPMRDDMEWSVGHNDSGSSCRSMKVATSKKCNGKRGLSLVFALFTLLKKTRSLRFCV